MIKRGMLMLAVGTLALLAACGSQDDGPEATVTRNPNVTNVPQAAVTTAAGTVESTTASPAPEGTAPGAGSPAATAAGSPTGAPAASPTSASAGSPVALTGSVEKGKAAAAVCLGCHSVDGGTSVGPTWKGLYGSQVELESGETVTADAAYLHESIVNPTAKIVKGYPPAMSSFSYLPEEQIADLIAYIESLKD